MDNIRIGWKMNEALKKTLALTGSTLVFILSLTGCASKVTESSSTIPSTIVTMPVSTTTSALETSSAIPTTSTATPVVDSGAPPSTPTGTSTTDEGFVIPPLAREPPNQIWTDGYDCYPNVLIVTAGTTVTWVDIDIIPFIVISDDGLFQGWIWYSDAPDVHEYGATFSFLFAYPGTFGYYLSPYYNTLVGEVIVVA